MNYVAVVRELYQRVLFHSKDTRSLQGLKIKKSGTFRVEGEDDLPSLTLIDINVAEAIGKGTGGVSMFLRTSRKHDWCKLTDDGENGLIDWMELVMDAAETMPSNGQPDQLMVMHTSEGAIRPGNDNQLYPLLIEPFRWDIRMAEINDLSFTLQMDLSWTIPQTKRARRRITPFSSPA